jgi:hypothetical protein
MITVARTRECPAFYKTLVSSGYVPVNGLEMFYEIHGNGNLRNALDWERNLCSYSRY